jgi:photosystem II stability/assembly factor-like uncharacterized protein
MDYDYAFWTSDDSGLTWTRTHDGIGRVDGTRADMSFFDALLGWACGERGLLWKTDDAGHTWTQAHWMCRDQPSDLKMYPNGQGVLIGANLRLLTSNYGESWTAHTPLWDEGVNQLQTQNMCALGENMLVTVGRFRSTVNSTLHGTISISQDRGRTWTPRSTIPDLGPAFVPSFENVQFLTPDLGFVFGFWLEYTGFVYKTTDGGNTWTVRALTPPTRQEITFGQMIDEFTGFALSASGGHIKVTTDGLSTWVNRSLHTAGGSGGEWERMRFTDAQNGWVGGYFGHVAKTTDGGVTWTMVSPPGATLAYAVSDIEVISPLEAYVVGTPNNQSPATRPVRVWRTTAAGATWTLEGHSIMHPDDPSFTSATGLEVVLGVGTWTFGFGGFVVSNVVPRTCPADFDDGTGTGTPDGGVGIEDLLYYLNLYEQGLVASDLDDGSGTGATDGGVGIEDLLYYLARYEAGC